MLFVCRKTEREDRVDSSWLRKAQNVMIVFVATVKLLLYLIVPSRTADFQKELGDTFS